MEEDRIHHPLEPIKDKNSKILILGSFPSVKSRDFLFYYAHLQNRFWTIMNFLLHEESRTVKEKKDMMLRHHIALWDVIESCRINGSSDASIKEVRCNDISSLIKETKVTHIYTNGKTAYQLFKKYQSDIELPVICLPSTSPANASYSLARLLKIWEKILENI